MLASSASSSPASSSDDGTACVAGAMRRRNETFFVSGATMLTPRSTRANAMFLAPVLGDRAQESGLLAAVGTLAAPSEADCARPSNSVAGRDRSAPPAAAEAEART